MFIDATGGEAFVQPTPHKITLALTNPAGTVTVEQEDDSGGWFDVSIDSTVIALSVDNTVTSIYAPFKLRVTATGTGVRLFNRGA